MHSCQPQQEIEPSNIEQFETTESTVESPQGSFTDDTKERACVKVLLLQFMKPLKGKENTQL